MAAKLNHAFMYAAEKLDAARRSLMLPHPRGEAQSLANAFHECMLGLGGVRLDDLDENARSWLRTIRETSDTEGIEDPTGQKGTWYIKAERLKDDEKQAFAHAVDELSHWFDRHAFAEE